MSKKFPTRPRLGALFAALLAAFTFSAPPIVRADGPIADNSFLIEEAYNQEPGVVQHIFTWQRDRDSGDWEGSFTQEWPFLSQKHQLSYTLVGSRGDFGTGFGDVALNYRYQWLDGSSGVAFSPRASLLLPTGDVDEGRGSGAVGLQINLPLSIELAPRWVAHTNAGLTWTPDAENAFGDQADTLSSSVGQSLVWLAHPKFNVLVEAVYANEQIPIGRGRTGHEPSFVVSPGLRGAWDFASGLQIVPGIAFPIGVGPSSGENGVFLYLSFEHPFGQ